MRTLEKRWVLFLAFLAIGLIAGTAVPAHAIWGCKKNACTIATENKSSVPVRVDVHVHCDDSFLGMCDATRCDMNLTLGPGQSTSCYNYCPDDNWDLIDAKATYTDSTGKTTTICDWNNMSKRESNRFEVVGDATRLGCDFGNNHASVDLVQKVGGCAGTQGGCK